MIDEYYAIYTKRTRSSLCALVEIFCCPPASDMTHLQAKCEMDIKVIQ